MREMLQQDSVALASAEMCFGGCWAFHSANAGVNCTLGSPSPRQSMNVSAHQPWNYCLRCFVHDSPNGPPVGYVVVPLEKIWAYSVAACNFVGIGRSSLRGDGSVGSGDIDNPRGIAGRVIV